MTTQAASDLTPSGRGPARARDDGDIGVTPAIEQLRERVAKGIEWLSANDPAGAFHFWFEAGLSSLSPMPTQSEETIAAWREYHRQRTRWERMSHDLARVDPENWSA